MFLISCDDHLIGEVGPEVVAGENAYDSDWAGVEQMFVDYCDVCHSPTGSGGFSLHEAIDGELNGGTGYYVVAGDAAASVMWQVISGSGTLGAMPPTGILAPELTGHVEEWINAGAPQ